MKVFVTGATGLVGSHLAEQLVESGDEVVALVRPTSDTALLDRLGVRTVTGDLADPVETLRAAMEGADAIVHGAALVYAGLPWERIREVNVEGTRGVLEAAAGAGVRRAVHLSSVAVYGGRVEPADEAAPVDTPIPPTDHYARSKREAEGVARSVSAEYGLPVSILRPAAIYGPRDRLFAPKLARLARLPVVPLLGSGRTRLPVVYAGNVAQAVVAALEPGAPVGTWNVGEDEPVGMRRLLELFSRETGSSPRFLPLPAPLVRGALRCSSGSVSPCRAPVTSPLPEPSVWPRATILI